MAFPPLSQTPFGLPPPQGADPPGYYYGWPLAGVVKRVGSAVIDYVAVWFALLLGIGLIGRGAATAQGGEIGSATAGWLFVVAYAAQCWNFIVRQGRSGQSFGKQLLGTRLIATSNLAAPGKAACFARNLALLVDVALFGIGLLSIAFSQRRTSFGDRLAGTVVIDERRAGATIAWAVPAAPSHTREAPKPHGAVPGWQPPSVWRRWLTSLPLRHRLHHRNEAGSSTRSRWSRTRHPCRRCPPSTTTRRPPHALGRQPMPRRARQARFPLVALLVTGAMRSLTSAPKPPKPPATGIWLPG